MRSGHRQLPLRQVGFQNFREFIRFQQTEMSGSPADDETITASEAHITGASRRQTQLSEPPAPFYQLINLRAMGRSSTRKNRFKFCPGVNFRHDCSARKGLAGRGEGATRRRGEKHAGESPLPPVTVSPRPVESSANLVWFKDAPLGNDSRDVLGRCHIEGGVGRAGALG